MNKLTKYIIGILIGLLICFLTWYFRAVLVYLIIAAVISLVGKPLMSFLRNFHIKKIKIPSWIAAMITISAIFTVLFSIFLLITPIIGQIINQLSNISLDTVGNQISGPLAAINEFIIKSFPDVTPSFKIESYAINELKGVIKLSVFSNIVNSIASLVMDFAIALFSIIFISFFFLMNDGMLTKIIIAALPEKYEENIIRASSSISNLLTRYFLGISLESFCITLINGLGLIFIVKMDTSLAIVIAFTSGILNVIPYVGPLAGQILAVLMGVITYSGAATSLSLGMYALIILIIFVSTQLIDNYVFQPLIYSSSVKAHPLEIFIVILLAGHMGGVIGMLIAIPSYTVLRVIASEFLFKFKIVQELTRNIKIKKPTS